MVNSFTYIDSIEEIPTLQTVLGAKPERISFDVETSGLDSKNDRILMLQLKVGESTFIIDCVALKQTEFKYILELLECSDALLVGHNIKFDLQFIYETTNILFKNVYCTQVAEAIITGGRSSYESLDKLAMKYLGVYLDKTVRDTFIEHEGPLTTEQIRYGTDDVEYLDDIYKLQLEIISFEKMVDVLELEKKLIPVVTMMELTGVKVDQDGWAELVEENERNYILVDEEFKKYIWNKVLHSELKDNPLIDLFDYLYVPVRTKRDRTAFSEIALDESAGLFFEWYNAGSWKQVVGVFELFGIPLKSTGEELLTNYIKYETKEKTHIELISILLKLREIQKKVTTYGEKFSQKINKDTGRIHASFNQIGTRTGRFSSNGPNMQNIPKNNTYRSKFISGKNYNFVTVDYSQQEYRLAGELSGEQKIIDAYLEDKDMHTLTGELLKDLGLTRDDGKTTNFAVLYGSSVYGLATSLKIPVKLAESVINIIRNNYPALMAYIETIQELVLKHFYSVTPLGRRRYWEKKTSFSSPEEYNRYIGNIRREGFNHVIQGGSADMMKLGMINIFYDNPFSHELLRIVITVHDEVVVEVHNDILDEGRKFIEDCLVRAGQVFHSKIPVKASANVSHCWSK